MLLLAADAEEREKGRGREERRRREERSDQQHPPELELLGGVGFAMMRVPEVDFSFETVFGTFFAVKDDESEIEIEIEIDTKVGIETHRCS